MKQNLSLLYAKLRGVHFLRCPHCALEAFARVLGMRAPTTKHHSHRQNEDAAVLGAAGETGKVVVAERNQKEGPAGNVSTRGRESKRGIASTVGWIACGVVASVLALV